VTEAERRAALDAIAEEVRACTACRLHEGRTSAVPGEGHPSTEVLFIGEAPGLNEDRQGRPFVGAAGGFLAELLGSIGWTRDDVFITNVVKCRPPQNRDPEPDEIAACAPFLRRQAEVLEPALVVTLGRHSMGRFLPGARIGGVHGTAHPSPPGLGTDDAMVFAMYHPAAALHQGSLRQTLLDDMALVPATLLEARRRRAAAIVTKPGVEAPAAEAATNGAVPPEATEAPVDPAPPTAIAVGSIEAAPDVPVDDASAPESPPDLAGALVVAIEPGEPEPQLTLF
jgi:DNA polymerase